MPLTTVASGRVFDWSHAVGRGAARGTGFNYIQTMCLGKGGVIYTANRGNENNFGMHVNKVQLGAPGEEELIADFCESFMRRAKIPIDAEIIEDLFVTTGVYLLDRSAARPMGTRASNEMCKTGNGGHSEPN